MVLDSRCTNESKNAKRRRAAAIFRLVLTGSIHDDDPLSAPQNGVANSNMTRGQRSNLKVTEGHEELEVMRCGSPEGEWGIGGSRTSLHRPDALDRIKGECFGSQSPQISQDKI